MWEFLKKIRPFRQRISQEEIKQLSFDIRRLLDTSDSSLTAQEKGNITKMLDGSTPKSKEIIKLLARGDAVKFKIEKQEKRK